MHNTTNSRNSLIKPKLYINFKSFPGSTIIRLTSTIKPLLWVLFPTGQRRQICQHCLEVSTGYYSKDLKKYKYMNNNNNVMSTEVVLRLADPVSFPYNCLLPAPSKIPCYPLHTTSYAWSPHKALPLSWSYTSLIWSWDPPLLSFWPGLGILFGILCKLGLGCTLFRSC